ncbi:hypothetical protein Tco_0689385 [Tanacetum coccineum]
MCRRASAKLSSKWRFRKISMNFKAKRHDNLFINLDYRRLGSSVVILRLGSFHCPLLPRFQLPPPGGFEVHHMKFLLLGGDCISYSTFGYANGSLDLTLVVAIPTVLVLVPTILIVGLAVVLHGRKTGWFIWFGHRWRSVSRNSLVEIGCELLARRYSRMLFSEKGVELELVDVLLSREVEALTISFIQQHRRSSGGGSARITLATMALLRELRTLDLLSMSLEQSAGTFCQKVATCDGVQRVLID